MDDKSLPTGERHISTGTLRFQDYEAEFAFPSRMRLYISNYGTAGVAGARHYFGRLEYNHDDLFLCVELTRPTLLIEREADPHLATWTNSFTTEYAVLAAARAFGAAHGVEVYRCQWVHTEVDGEKLADLVETVI